MSTAMPPKLSLASTVRLASGYEMPLLGFGVYKTSVPQAPADADGNSSKRPAEICQTVVGQALAAGYRHIDSATAYRNERACALAIAAAAEKQQLRRADVFFTTKLPPRLRGYDATAAAIDDVLGANPELGGYVDLYLIHAPYGSRDDRLGQWRAMVAAQRAGKIRSLGVSNYGVHHLDELRAWQRAQAADAAGVLSVGQWELHPWLARRPIVDWCAREGVAVQAYSPLARGTRLHDPLLQPLLASHPGRTTAQLLIRWSLQMGFVPLPKTTHAERIRENADVFGFELADEEVRMLDTGRYEPSCWDPTVEGL